MLDAQMKTVAFLQGPLGQTFAKPTTMLAGRLPWLASMLFAHYSKGWKATEVLGGREGSACEGTEMDPEGLPEVLAKLVMVHDPYDLNAAGMTMMARLSCT